MYDVMIIDDDQAIRDRLKTIIEWENIGVHLVCEAQDSDSARELFMLNRPNIVITDIHIPIITGLELAQELLVIDPEIRFIVITGYSDFNYVKDAVKLGAIDLISKPILPADINASLQKAVGFFEKIRIEQTSSQNLQLLLEESLPTLQEKFISYILSQNRNYMSKDIFAKFETLHISMKGSFYTIILVRPIFDDISTMSTDAILIAIKNSIDEILRSNAFNVYSYYDNNYYLNCVIGWEFENSSDVLESVMISINKKVDFLWGIRLFAGIGVAKTDIACLHEAHHEANIALNYQGIHGLDSVISYQNIMRMGDSLILDKSKVLEQSIALFKTNDLDSVLELMQSETIHLLSSTKDNGIQAARKFVFEFISSLIEDSMSIGINTETINHYSDICGKVFASDSIQSLMQYMHDFMKNISKEIYNKRSESKNLLIKMAQDFINSNLGNENLKLEMVSRHVGLSSIYFCTLFHKEEGITFNDYVTLVRINRAKSLLIETNMKVFEVSNAVGYVNPKYFNYVYKRITGMTPLEYRNST